jgi:hypothetical protein
VKDTIAVARGVSWRVIHIFFTNKAFLLPSMFIRASSATVVTTTATVAQRTNADTA